MNDFASILKQKMDERNESIEPKRACVRLQTYPRSQYQWVDHTLSIMKPQSIHPRARRIFIYNSPKRSRNEGDKVIKTELQSSKHQPPPRNMGLHMALKDMPPSSKKAYQEFLHLGANLSRNGAHWHEIKREYRKLARRLHPDSAEKGVDPKCFIELSEAFHALTQHHGSVLRNNETEK